MSVGGVVARNFILIGEGALSPSVFSILLHTGRAVLSSVPGFDDNTSFISFDGNRMAAPGNDTNRTSNVMLTTLICLTFWVNLYTAALIIDAETEFKEDEPLADAAVTLKCHRRTYTYRVTQTDENGKQCWDVISVYACWGRCDSNEIADWRFPYKKSNHPVCVHYGRNRAFVTLRHCEEGVKEGTDHYEYLEADDCKCQLCSSSDTSCEGLRYRPHRSDPSSVAALGFRGIPY